ncbi:MAG: hypothetical protein ABJ327_08575 [Litoreibacter sp.]
MAIRAYFSQCPLSSNPVEKQGVVDAETGVLATVTLGGASLASFLQRAISRTSFARRASIWIGVIPTELPKRFTSGANVLVVLGIPFKVCTRRCAVGAPRLVDHWDSWRKLR